MSKQDNGKPKEDRDGVMAESPIDPVTHPVSAELSLKLVFGGSSVRRYASFDPRTPEGMVISDKCDLAPDKRIADMLNLEFSIQHFLMHWVQVPGQEDGEIVDAVRTCLITTDNEVLACCSDGIRSSVMRLVEQHGLPPWKNGVPVKVVNVPTRKGWKMLALMNNPPLLQTKGKKS